MTDPKHSNCSVFVNNVFRFQRDMKSWFCFSLVYVMSALSRCQATDDSGSWFETSRFNRPTGSQFWKGVFKMTSPHFHQWLLNQKTPEAAGTWDTPRCWCFHKNAHKHWNTPFHTCTTAVQWSVKGDWMERCVVRILQLFIRWGKARGVETQTHQAWS